MRKPSGNLLFADLNNAEKIAIRVLQDDKIAIRSVSPGIASCSDSDEPLDFAVLVACIQVEVQSAAFA